MTQDDHRLVLPGQQILLNEWLVHAEAGLPARRSDMHPAQFLHELAFISIVEKDGGNLTFRLGGTEIRRVMGVEPRGRRVGRLDTLGGDRTWSETVRSALVSGQPVLGASGIGFGRTHWWLRLPLIDDDGRQRLVLCHDRIIEEGQALDDMAAPIPLNAPLSFAA